MSSSWRGGAGEENLWKGGDDEVAEKQDDEEGEAGSYA